jgi:hypothetical protein
MTESRKGEATRESMFHCDECKVTWWYVLPFYEFEGFNEASNKCPCCAGYGGLATHVRDSATSLAPSSFEASVLPVLHM